MGSKTLVAAVFGVALLSACTEPGVTQAGSSSGAAEGSSDTAAVDASSSGASEEVEPCCGCLCRDPLWSCSQETCVDGNGQAVALGPEAGFLELGDSAFSLGTPPQVFTAAPQRVWYAFRPARTEPESRPLLVFFNGGPGTATTSGLFAMNTGPKMVDTESIPPRVVDNPHDWSAFANLLYLDMPGTGFSLPGTPTSVDGIGPWHPEGEAATSLRAVLGFVDRHPQLGGDVVPVGESFGGRRAMLMARLVTDTATLRTGFRDSGFRDAALADQIDAFGPDKFGRYIMIQGAIQTYDQLVDEPFDCPLEAPICDPVADDLERRFRTCAEVLSSITGLSDALGVDALGIDGLDPSELRQFSFISLEEQPWQKGDHSGRTFADIVRRTEWFATDAALDPTVRMHQLVQILDEDYPDLLEGASVRAEGEGPRPGTLHLEYADGAERTIRYPHYAEAGHAVSAYQPEELRDDVQAWLAETSAR